MLKKMTDKEDEAELVRIVAETAKERAAAQRLRAEITSVTASLESEKREIETALHIENDLMSPSVISDPSSAFFEEVADPDEATTARSLEMQLDATQKTLRETLELEKNLLRQIQSLRQRDAVDLEEHENEDSESTATRIVKELESSAIASRDSGFREHTSAIKWRERTLPNLILLSGDQERGKTPALLSGIVVERVFEGIVTFTSCLARTSHPASPSLKGKKPDEIHLRDVGQPENACATDLARVFSEYAALDIESANYSDRVRLVALKAALLDVQHLLNSHKTETELPRGTIVENPASGEKNSSEMSPLVASSDDTSSTQVGKADNNFLHEPTASLPSLSHSSRVMNQLNFARLLSAAPSRFHNCDLKRLYCTATDGTSLGTLYKKVAGVAPTILCVRDTNGGVFGCYAPSPWKDSSKWCT